MSASVVPWMVPALPSNRTLVGRLCFTYCCISTGCCYCQMLHCILPADSAT